MESAFCSRTRHSCGRWRACLKLSDAYAPICGIISSHLRRADREAEGARLLSEYRTQSYLGFESPALRQNVMAPQQWGAFLCVAVAGDSNPRALAPGGRQRTRAPSRGLRYGGTTRAGAPPGAEAVERCRRQRGESPALRQNVMAPQQWGAFLCVAVAEDSNRGALEPYLVWCHPAGPGWNAIRFGTARRGLAGTQFGLVPPSRCWNSGTKRNSVPDGPDYVVRNAIAFSGSPATRYETE